MPTKTYGSQRKRSPSVSIVTLGILVIGLIGGALILQAGGVIQIPLLTKKEEGPKAPDNRGKVAVPRTVRTVPAYARITRDHLMGPDGMIACIYLPPSDVTEAMLTHKDLGKILGRVAKREKPPGYVFTEADFYPEGTRPGPTAGVPPGKRAMRLKASAVPGLHGLNQFDRFDLVMTVTVEVEDQPMRGGRNDRKLDVDGPYQELVEKAAAPTPSARIKRQHAEVKTIVNNGTVVQPVSTRQETGTTSSLLKGSKQTTTPVEEIIIAVDPDEVAALNLALAIHAQLQVAMRSGQVSEDLAAEGEIPDIEIVLDEVEAVDETGEVSTVKIVEVIRGGEKVLMAVPRPSNGQDEQNGSDDREE